MDTERRPWWRAIGPGIAVAATGVGAGDMIAAVSAGARFGVALGWAAIVGAVLKFALNEGLARWQLATGTTLLEGWSAHFGGIVRFVFGAYLVLWSFIVAGALTSACGLAAHALAPALSIEAWGVAHALAGAAVVLTTGYGTFERTVKFLIAAMFVTLVGAAAWIGGPEPFAAIPIEAAVPENGLAATLAVLGGVGGSVTMLSYGYWIRERRWSGTERLRLVRVDLGVAYALTGLFGVAVLVLSTVTLHGGGDVSGKAAILALAETLGETFGPAGRWTFLVGFWAAVATSLLGVWQGVPYLFCDFVRLGRRERGSEILSTRSPWYRGYLMFLVVPPLVLLWVDDPFAIGVAYAALGALFMPFVAGTLLILLRLRGPARGVGANGVVATIALVACLSLFAFLGWQQLATVWARLVEAWAGLASG